MACAKNNKITTGVTSLHRVFWCEDTHIRLQPPPPMLQAMPFNKGHFEQMLNIRRQQHACRVLNALKVCVLDICGDRKHKPTLLSLLCRSCRQSAHKLAFCIKTFLITFWNVLMCILICTKKCNYSTFTYARCPGKTSNHRYTYLSWITYFKSCWVHLLSLLLFRSTQSLPNPTCNSWVSSRYSSTETRGLFVQVYCGSRGRPLILFNNQMEKRWQAGP